MHQVSVQTDTFIPMLRQHRGTDTQGRTVKAFSRNTLKPSQQIVGELTDSNHLAVVLLVDGERIPLARWEWTFYIESP